MSWEWVREERRKGGKEVRRKGGKEIRAACFYSYSLEAFMKHSSFLSVATRGSTESGRTSS